MTTAHLFSRTVVLACVVLASACERNSEASTRSLADEARDLAKASRRERATVFSTSRRCSECHGRQYREWTGSAHARAAGGVFARVRESLSAAERAGCDSCHVPLAGAPERIASDGVGCDACHTAVGQGEGAAVLALDPGQATKFGPYADSEDHHFHRVAFSAFVTGAELCEACHSDRPGTELPIFTSTAEWRAGPKRAVACQSCHMPEFRAEAAEGEQRRTVNGHAFGGGEGEKQKALAAAIDVAVRLERRGGTPVAQVAVTNVSGGHALPTDLPERRLALVVEAHSAEGKVLRSARQVFGRTLVDAEGKLAPFFRAVREAADTRLQPGEAKVESMDLPAGTTKVVATLVYERFDRELAPVYGESAPLQVARKERLLEGTWD